MAMLDLKGKMLGVPVYELLGGRCHETLLAYASGGSSYWPEDKLLGTIECYIKTGYRAVKLGGGLYESQDIPIYRDPTPAGAAATEVMKAEILKKNFGSSFQLLLDGHMDNMTEQDMIWNEATAAAVLAALAPYGSAFLRSRSPTPTSGATGRSASGARSRSPAASA